MKTDSTGQEALFDQSEPVNHRLMARSFDAARLTQARVLAGMTKQALAEAVRVTPAAIGQFESRVSSPRPDLLPRLASALDVPVAFFAGGRPLGQVDSSQAHFRSLRSTRSIDRARALTFVEQVWELLVELEKHVALPRVNIPEDLAGSGASPEAAARALRKSWGIPSGAVKHLMATMEYHGIALSMLSLASVGEGRVDAFSTAAFDRPIVVVTPERSKSVYVQRFTCAHELGHLVLHREAIPGDPQHEREADAFAAEFLTPREELAPLLPKTVNLPLLDELSRMWGVSAESLLKRMSELGTVSEASIRRGYQRLNQLRSAGLRTEPSAASFPGEQPAMLKQAAELAEDNGTGLAEVAEKLQWSLRRVREVLGMNDSRPILRIVR